MEGMKNPYTISVINLEGKTLLGRQP